MRGISWKAVVITVVLGTAVGIAAGTFLAWWMPLADATGTKFWQAIGNPFGGKAQVRILMIGEDDSAQRNSNGNGLSDTLVVLAINTQTKDIRALSIPRDTRVEIPRHGTGKINAAHVYGGPELTRQVVQDLVGVPLDYYVKTNTAGLRDLVDLVGGVYIKIDRDMRYRDRRGGLCINLKAGPDKQLLDGDKAEQYVRFRHDRYGDSGYEVVDGKKIPRGRIERQQIFMRALANRILSLPTKRERAEVLRQACERKLIVTDLNLKDWDGLADYFKDIKPEEMVMEVLPGKPGNVGGGSYWLPDYDKLGDSISRTLLFQDPEEDDAVTIEVLNGSGIVGMANRVADRLRDAGFEVTRTDNAERFDYSRCCIIAHGAKSGPVEQLAKLLNCDDVREGAAQHDGADVTVIVGRDFGVKPSGATTD